MGSISIKKKYFSKIQQLKKHNQLYYEKSTPKISDKEFDILKKEILELEKKYDFLKNKESPSISVGYKPSKNFVKFKHRVQMLSLSNAIDKEDLQNFEKRIFNFLNLNKNNIIEYSVEPKIDGISASLTYKRSEEHTSELQSQAYLVCRLLLEKKTTTTNNNKNTKQRNHQ